MNNMNEFDYTISDGTSTINLHFSFKTDRELLTEWDPDGEEYYVGVRCTGGSGTTYTGGTAHNWTYDHSAFAAMGTPLNHKDVYGCYFRENISDIGFLTHVGIDPTQDNPAGVVQIPSYDCNIDTYSYLTPNEYQYTYDGVVYSGSFNETQGWLSWMMFVNQILIQIWDTPGFTSVTGDFDIEIDTNIPIFDTYQHFRAYIDDGSTEGLLNGELAPEEEDFGKYYMNNLVCNTPSIGQVRYEYYYKWDGPDKCLGLASEDGITATLYTFNGGPSAVYKSDDRGASYEQVGGYPNTYYKQSDRSVPFYVLAFSTNIPCFVGDDVDSGVDKLDSFMNGTPAPSGREYTADDAFNRSSLDDVDIFGAIGDVVNQTTNGVSSIAYTYGVQMFNLSATQKATFLRDILSAAKVNDLLDNTKLFGSNQIGALQSLRYFPIDVSEVCTEGSAPSCQIGSYTYTFSSSVNQILRNDKLINMGEQFFRSPYEDGDFRNYEPWCKLYVLLPYAGIHELVISRYINKRVGIKLAVDVTTGACEYHLYASGLEMDSFQGQMGSQIPLTANDKASQVSAVQNGILTSVSGLAQSASDTQQTIGAAGSMITGGMDTGKALTSGGPFTPGINALNSGVTIAQGAQTAIRNFLNAPIQTKGASAGNLGDFGVNSPYFIFAWANSIVPKNEINLVGKPSNQGGKVGEFAGYLKCSAFRLANGFTGTAAEAAQIAAQMMEGVYI